MTSSASGLELSRTLNGLKWAPSVWRPERSLKKVQSDPTFTASCTKLPAVLNRRLGAASTCSSPSKRRQTNVSPKRLLAGTTSQVGFHNSQPSQSLVLPSIGAGAAGGAGVRIAVHGSDSRRHSRALFVPTVDNIEVFEHTVDAVKESISGIYTSLDRFEGGSHNTHQRSAKNKTSAHEVVDEDGETLKDRLMRYRYVKKIEPPPEPLERLPLEFEPVEDGKFILENTSMEAIKAYGPAGRKQMYAEIAELREQRLAKAKAWRLKDDRRRIHKGLAKAQQFEERMMRRTSKQEQLALAAADAGRAPERSMQAKKWQTSLVMVTMMQMFAKIHSRFKEVNNTYLDYLEKEGLISNPQPRNLPMAAYQNVMNEKFVEVAQFNMQEEWRLITAPPRLRPLWSVWIYSSPTRRGSKEISLKRPDTEQQKVVHVEVPDVDELRHIQQKAVFMQSMILTRFKWKGQKSKASKVVHSLQRWKSGGPLIAMMAFLNRVRKVQRFVRWGLRRIRETRSDLEAKWLKLESAWISSHPEAGECTRGQGASAHHRRDRDRKGSDAPGAHHGHGHDHAGSNDHASGHHGYPHADHGTHHRPRPHLGSHGTRHNLAEHADGHFDADASHCSAVSESGHVTRSVSKRHPGGASRKVSAPDENADRRRRFLREELHRRRIKYLPRYEVWLGDMQLYWRYVYEWRGHRKECRGKKVKPWLELPQMPPCPSHLPSEEELLDFVKKGLANKLTFEDKQVKKESTRQPGGRVAALALAADVDQRKRSKDEVVFKVEDAEGAKPLCDEVADILAPSASRPVPVASTAVHRPLMPDPI